MSTRFNRAISRFDHLNDIEFGACNYFNEAQPLQRGATTADCPAYFPTASDQDVAMRPRESRARRHAAGRPTGWVGSRTLFFGASLILLVLSLNACDERFSNGVDRNCRPLAAPPPPWVTLGNVALFSSDGRPVDAASARVYCSQGMSSEERALYFSERSQGFQLVGERMVFAVGPDVVRNSVTCGLSSIILRHCGAPLRVRVEIPGCVPQEISWTWEENLQRSAAVDISFYVPVLLRCAGDASTSPPTQDASRLDAPGLSNSDVP